MATDKLIYEYAIHFTKAFAKFIGVEGGDYEAKSITLKQTEKRADLFLISPSGTNVVLVETQGYDDAYLYHRMVTAKMLYCLQFRYFGKMDAIAIFLEESHFRAAELFHEQFDATAALKFSPKIIVLGRLKVDELRRTGDVYLIPLFPLCDISPSEIEQQAPAWAEQIKTAPELDEEERRSLIGLLGGFMSHRIKALSRNLLNKILGGLSMEDTLVGQEIMRLGTQRMLLKQIAARFGVVPEDIRQKIQEIDNDDDLDQIAVALFKIQSVDELKKLIH
jgi:predicted transposase YdaD